MKKQTKQFIDMALTSDETVSGEHKRLVMEAVNLEPYLPDKIFLTQHETAHVLSISRQTVRSLVKQGILHPVDINWPRITAIQRGGIVDTRQSQKAPPYSQKLRSGHIDTKRGSYCLENTRKIWVVLWWFYIEVIQAPTRVQTGIWHLPDQA